MKTKEEEEEERAMGHLTSERYRKKEERRDENLVSSRGSAN